METEKQFKEIFGKMSHDQLLDYAYKLRTEVETLQEKNSSLKRAMYGRKKENVNIDSSPFSMKLNWSMNLLNLMK